MQSGITGTSIPLHLINLQPNLPPIETQKLTTTSLLGAPRCLQPLHHLPLNLLSPRNHNSRNPHPTNPNPLLRPLQPRSILHLPVPNLLHPAAQDPDLPAPASPARKQDHPRRIDLYPLQCACSAEDALRVDPVDARA